MSGRPGSLEQRHKRLVVRYAALAQQNESLRTENRRLRKQLRECRQASRFVSHNLRRPLSEYEIFRGHGVPITPGAASRSERTTAA